MIDQASAERIALEKAESVFRLRDKGDEIQIREEKTVERPDGWVFYYNSRAFVQTGDFNRMLVGNRPLFVSRSDGAVLSIRGEIAVDRAVAEAMVGSIRRDR